MKVKDFIKYLEALDQEKNIWVVYDGFAVFEPTPDMTAGAEEVSRHGKKGVELDDYIISAG